MFDDDGDRVDINIVLIIIQRPHFSTHVLSGLCFGDILASQVREMKKPGVRTKLKINAKVDCIQHYNLSQLK